MSRLSVYISRTHVKEPEIVTCPGASNIAESHAPCRGKQSYGAGTGRSVLCVKTSLQRGGGGRARANQGRGLGRGANEGARIAPWRKPPERLSLKYFVSILD